ASVTPCLPFPIAHFPFDIRHSTFVIRHSSFVIRHSSFLPAMLRIALQAGVIRTFPPRHSPHPAAHSRVHRTADNSTDWQALREDFPILNQQVHGHPLIYFDNAATTQKPRNVLDALRHHYERDNANVHRGLHELSSRATEAYESARSRVAEYIGAANAGEIVF